MKKFWVNVAASAAAGFGAGLSATGSPKQASAAAALAVLANTIGLVQLPPQATTRPKKK